MENELPKKSSIKLFQVIVVLVIVAVLVGMLMPLIGVTLMYNRWAKCGKNQSQILGALVAYATSEETNWTDPRGTTTAWKMPVGPITTALDGAKFTAGTFELLAVSQSIPSALFKCPSTSWGGPARTWRATLRETDVLWGWDPPSGVAVSYGFDWASSSVPSADRVILADREVSAHRDFVVVAFGDAHVKKLKLVKVVRGAGELVTETRITAPHQFGTSIQPDDDIFSAEGDPGDPLTPGKGDPLRAWVK